MLDQPLDLILSSPNKVRVLRAMVYVTRPISGRHAARIAGTSKKAQQALDELADVGLIIRGESTGQYLYSFNFDNYLAPAVTALFQAEADRAKSLLDELRAALVQVDGVVAAAIIGSSARGTARPDSDLDLYIVVEKQSQSRTVTDALLDRAVDLNLRYGVRLSPVVIGRQRWNAELKDPTSLAATAAKEGRLFAGEW